MGGSNLYSRFPGASRRRVRAAFPGRRRRGALPWRQAGETRLLVTADGQVGVVEAGLLFGAEAMSGRHFQRVAPRYGPGRVCWVLSMDGTDAQDHRPGLLVALTESGRLCALPLSAVTPGSTLRLPIPDADRIRTALRASQGQVLCIARSSRSWRSVRASATPRAGRELAHVPDAIGLLALDAR